MAKEVKKMRQNIEDIVDDDVRMPLYWCYFFLLLCVIHIFVKIMFGDIVSKPLTFSINLVFDYICLSEITKIKESMGRKHWRHILISITTITWVSYSGILLVYGTQVERVVTLLAPLYFSWRFAIKPFIHRRRADKATEEKKI